VFFIGQQRYANEGPCKYRSVHVSVCLQRVDERCRRHTGFGWLTSRGGLTGVL